MAVIGLRVEVIGDKGETLSSHLVLSHAFDAESLQFGLEVVQHDCVSETFEHETQFPEWIDARTIQRLTNTTKWKDSPVSRADEIVNAGHNVKSCEYHGQADGAY